jgi:hypothetical protein
MIIEKCAEAGFTVTMSRGPRLPDEESGGTGHTQVINRAELSDYTDPQKDGDHCDLQQSDNT